MSCGWRFWVRAAVLLSLLGGQGDCFVVNGENAVETEEPLTIPAGLEYIHHRTGNEPWSIHVIRIDRRPHRYDFVSTLSDEHIFGLKTLPQQVKALGDRYGKAWAAVNGDFFIIRPDLYQGDPQGLQICRGQLVSTPKGTSFWIDREGRPHIEEVISRFRAVFADGSDVRFLLNETRPSDGAVLYTPAIGPSTRTSGGVEYELEPLEKDTVIRAGATIKAKVINVHQEGNRALRPGSMILSVGSTTDERLRTHAVNETVTLNLDTSPGLDGVQTAIGGGPVLIREGKLNEWKGQQPRHPRTAIGFNDDTFVLLVVDGRQKGLSAGMTFGELAEWMKRLGCVEAMNLDGGGSSTLWLNGKIMNSPSDGQPRRIANGIVVVEKSGNQENPQP